jgi:ubiquinone biosynthesis protein COQ9
MDAASKHEEARRRLLEATLAHVSFDGWSHTALAAGARDLGLETTLVADLFPGGPAEAVELFSREADRAMVDGLAGMDLAVLRVRERIAAGVRLRLEQLAPRREAVRRGLSFLALPANAALAARCLGRTVDEIWHAAGDRSTDFNFYTKRGLLAAVHGATLLYWLEDKSEGSAETWAFLDRRIAEVLQVPRLLGRLGELAKKLPDPFLLWRRRARR